MQSALTKLKLGPNLFDFNSTNYAVDSASGNVVEIEAPLSHSAAADLQKADATITMGNSSEPVKIVGAVYNPVFSPSALLVAYLINKVDIGFIDASGQLLTVKPKPDLELRKFYGAPVSAGDNGHNDGYTDERNANDSKPAALPSGKVEPLPSDRGSLIAARETCFSVGLDQVCFTFKILDKAAIGAVQAAYTKLSNVYDLTQIQFDSSLGAVGDVTGDKQRMACRDQIQALSSQVLAATVLKACQATTYYAAPIVTNALLPTTRVLKPTTGIRLADISRYPVTGIIVVPDSTGLLIDTIGNLGGELYAADGSHVASASLPAGEYLMLSMRPDAKAGDQEPFLLVDANKNAFILPGRHIEAFGRVLKSSSTPAPFYQAAINDPASCQGMLP